jgi:hypothetical protein
MMPKIPAMIAPITMPSTVPLFSRPFGASSASGLPCVTAATSLPTTKK